MKSHKLLTTAGIGALMFGMTSAAMADNWRYAHEEYEGDVQDVFAVAFKEYVEENSDHSVQIYRFGELGESDDIMEQTRSGILQFVNQSPGFTGSLIPSAQIFFIPYLLPTDMETVLEFFDESKAINEMFPELYAEHGLELLQMYPEGEMVVTTDEPIESVDDFQNKKIRVMTNPLLSETYNAFGATPTPLPWGEVYGGLQTGILDGQENPIFWIESGGLYEVSPHLTFTGHGWFTTAMMANQDFFNGLSEEDQQLVRDASEAAYDHTIEHIQGLAEESLNKITEACDNCTVTRLNDEQIAKLKEKAPQVEEAFVEMAGEQGAELLEQFHADLEAVTSDEE
ncbi:TRAP-type C4-dicarboxylate transport system, substrate-binding protein [Halomonas shengliensis]|uniref:TRAP-type C4-dicarboxylate transport system, substrate-binding protein n=1 Tax=Halomonas shengliensis TaxID=419597 RepID=A0A1H0JHG9_9GAMM|nr:TRAP transporter substrate-binding protein DctP [Halomonas shengliensis]SDO42923.1 TRAP-type C4-dicarboxylate transport system, substrate-binding protein [Halomonas shengliensis]